MAVPTVSTSVTELPESRVRVEAEVPPEEVEKSIAHAARTLGRSLRVPGFRAGKAPAPVVIKRIGREAVLDEAVRDSIGAWYSAAIDAAAGRESDIDPAVTETFPRVECQAASLPPVRRVMACAPGTLRTSHPCRLRALPTP